jgi:hypothetical protein
VPVPQVRDLAELNQLLLERCNEDARRVIGERTETKGSLMVRERAQLRALAKEGFDLAEVSFPQVDGGVVNVANTC